LAKGSETATEVFANIRTVRAFGMEPKEGQLYSAAIDNVYALGKKKAFAYASFIALVSILAYGAIVLVM
jgi:ABC-type multidrug transport system fused ATPase/permease subunit